MTFLEFVDKTEHLIGAFRAGALTEAELLQSLAELTLQPESLNDLRLEIVFADALEACRELRREKEENSS